MNTPITATRVALLTQASRTYLDAIDQTIDELETSLAKCNALRACIKREILGENPTGISKVLDNAGPAIKAATDEVESMNNDLVGAKVFASIANGEQEKQQ